MTRPIDVIAYEIIEDWNENSVKGIPNTVKPFLNAMTQLNSIEDSYGYDSAEEIIKLFIINASRFYKTQNSKKYLDELKKIVNWKN